MELTDLRPRSMRRMTAALRAREPIHLDLREEAGRPLDEIVPLCTSVRDPAHRSLLPPGPDTPAPPVTAMVPTHQRVPLGLSALRDQDTPLQILILSNGPGGPRTIPGATVHRLPWRGHGATRQDGVALVQTPYVLMMTDDTIPLGGGCVRTLVEALEAGEWDAVVARQVPWPDADPVTRARLRAWTPPGNRVVAMAQVDHVATLYRTETLRRHPLPDVAIAEDAWWSRGRRVGYVPMAPVLHSHVRRPRSLYLRNRDIHAELVRMGRPPTVPSAWALGRALPAVARPLLKGAPLEAANQLAELLGQWQGARSAR